MNPKVSVIVPVYNVEKYLDRCVTSIVGQTLKDIEVILVDDSSPDKCPAMCDNWAVRDKRIKVVHKQNEGLGLTRNAGMGIAQGEYVAFVDSDDFVEPDMYERLYAECKKNNLDCIYSEFNVDDYPGFRVVTRPEKLYVGAEEIEQLRLDIVGAEPSYISGVKYQCSTCKGMYKLDIIKKYSLQFCSERQYISEDMLFNLDFLYHSERVKIVPWQFYHYCKNDASLSHSYRADRWEKLLFMLTVLNDEGKYQDKEELKLRLKRTAIFYSMIAISQEWKRKDQSYSQKKKAIREIENEQVIVETIKNYPIRKLPIKWMIYSFLLKAKILEYTYCFIG